MNNFPIPDKKQVLRDVSGEFRSCELSAVMGPSGSGKSTLLNILSGFTQKNVKGEIRINGADRLEASFRKQSTYIMQEENLHPALTVCEAMTFAVKLKTGNALNGHQQHDKISQTLKTLNLCNHMDTPARNLSGGQKKRLSIALELVDDPTIIFLDEPTTGLDSTSSTQCVKLLKNLAYEGKIIICTIHTPSALLFEMFDHLYALANGCCIYQGSSKNLVPFLSELNLQCPPTFNPADFLLEIATNDYGSQNDHLTRKINNGRNKNYRKNSENINKCFSVSNGNRLKKSSSYFHQFIQLLRRNFLILRRDPSSIILRFFINFLVGILVGTLYFGNGNDASQIFSIFKYIFVSIFFLMYTSYYSLQTSCKYFLN